MRFNKIIIIVIIVLISLLFSLQTAMGSTNQGYNYEGIMLNNYDFDGVYGTISYANPVLYGSRDHSLEGISLRDVADWIEGGWVKDNAVNDPHLQIIRQRPIAFFENYQAGSINHQYYYITPQDHTYKIQYAGMSSDYRSVFALYIDDQFMDMMYLGQRYCALEAKGEVYNTSGNKFSQMGVSSITQLHGRYNGNYSLWTKMFPYNNTYLLSSSNPYYVGFYNYYYNFYNGGGN